MNARIKYMDDIYLKMCPKTPQLYFNENLRICLFHNYCLGDLKLVRDFFFASYLALLRLLK